MNSIDFSLYIWCILFKASMTKVIGMLLCIHWMWKFHFFLFFNFHAIFSSKILVGKILRQGAEHRESIECTVAFVLGFSCLMGIILWNLKIFYAFLIFYIFYFFICFVSMHDLIFWVKGWKLQLIHLSSLSWSEQNLRRKHL